MQIVYYTIIALVGGILGLPIMLLSKEKKKSWIPESFILGNAFVIIITFWMSSCLSQGMNVWARFMLSILVLIALLVIVWKRKLLGSYFESTTKQDILSVIIAYMAGLLPLMIYIIWKAEFPYCDGYTYICTSDYLMEHGYNVSIDIQEAVHHPWLSQMFIYQTYHFRIGAQMLLAFWSSVFGVEFSLELFLPICGLGIMLCGMATWIFVSNIKKCDNNEKIYAIIVFCFNIPIIQWCAMYGFLPQILGSAFCLAAIALIFNVEKWHKLVCIELVETAVVTAAFALTYNEMLPFFVMIIITFIVYEIVVVKGISISIIKSICAIAFLAMCLIITYIPGMISAVFSLMGAAVGWNQNKDIITYMAQVFSVIPPEYNLHEGQVVPFVLVAEVLVIIIMGIICKGYKKSDKTVRYYYMICTAPYLVVCLYFVFFTENPFVGGKTNTWSVYKLVQYYAVVLLPFIAIFVIENLKKYPKILICIMGTFLVFNGYQGINYMKQLSNVMKEYTGSDVPLEEYYKLYDEYGNSQETIELTGVPGKHRQMVTYFLKNVKLNSDWNTDGYYSSIPANEESSDMCLYYNKTDANAIAGLVKIENSLLFPNGFYEEERNEEGRFWRWGQQEAEIEPMVNKDVKEGIIEFDIFPYIGDETEQVVDIYSENGNLIQHILLKEGNLLHTSIIWTKEMGKLRLVYNGVATDTEDGRSLAFAISNYTLNVMQ